MQSFLKACREFNALYKEATEFLSKNNYCAIGCDGCNETRFMKKRYPNSPDRWTSLEKGLCCIGCASLGPKGCTVKALTCRTWLCGAAWQSLTIEQREQVKELKKRTDAFAWVFRGNKVEHIRQHLHWPQPRHLSNEKRLDTH